MKCYAFWHLCGRSALWFCLHQARKSAYQKLVTHLVKRSGFYFGGKSLWGLWYLHWCSCLCNLVIWIVRNNRWQLSFILLQSDYWIVYPNISLYFVNVRTPSTLPVSMSELWRDIIITKTSIIGRINDDVRVMTLHFWCQFNCRTF